MTVIAAQAVCRGALTNDRVWPLGELGRPCFFDLQPFIA